ncbi:MAG: hypothetical protein CML06_08250 [Pseudomonadales bacterium]|nr:hypothetical protein [Pseudomonadales bacterium]MAR90860.1 hypothetical protein [Pseudomonadales bacterium]
MTQQAELTVAIVSYNSYSVITACLDELIKSGGFHVIIVDNASTDGSGDKLKQTYPDVQVIQEPVNLGYGRAANVAIKKCITPYFFLVNPDLKADVESTGKLLATIRSSAPSTALVAPATTRKKHTKTGLVEKQWVIGAAMMFSMEHLRTVGLFDEQIFLFSEESDLCKRIIQEGYKIYLDTDIYIEHLYRQSSTPSPETQALKDWHKAWSKLYLHHKHQNISGKHRPSRVALGYAIKWMLATQPEKRLRYKYRFQGSLAFLQGKPAILESGAPFHPLKPKQH